MVDFLPGLDRLSDGIDLLLGNPLFKKNRHTHGGLYLFDHMIKIADNKIKHPEQKQAGRHRANGCQRKHTIFSHALYSLLYAV